MFFLGAAIWSFAAIALWLGVLLGAFELKSAFDPTTWHAHEMIFGYTIAVMAGFLLTAIPNWTGRMPLQGRSLVILFSIWFAGRLAILFSASIGGTATMILDLAFLTVLLGVVLLEVVAGQNWRNLPMPLAVCVLLIANGLTHIEQIGGTATVQLGLRLGIAVMIVMICLIGGRIIPSFTHSWLKTQNEKTETATSQPTELNRFDVGCIFVTLFACSAWVAVPDHLNTGTTLIAAALFNALRMARWCGHLTLAEPLVWSLHLGFLWVAAGLGLLGLSIVQPGLIPTSTGLHALTAGAIGTMTLAVMTRATLGHSGRALTADLATTAIYIFITLAATIRVVAPLMSEYQSQLFTASAVCWGAAFGVFIIHYGRIIFAR